MRTFAQKPKSTRQTTSSKSTKPSRAFLGQSRDVQSILHLQRTIGNQAVLRLLQTETENINTSSASSTSTGFAHDFSQIPVQATALSNIQPKLKVNVPGDQNEQEADRVADQVLRQKMTGEEAEKVEIQAKGLPQLTVNEGEVNEKLQHQLSRSKGGGNPISDQVRAFVEPRVQFDFSKVQIHKDNKSAQMNQELGARAFTHGRDIYFGVGQYNPQSIEGKRLLAHELTHVVQQSTGRQSWHIAREISDAGVADVSLPPLPSSIHFDDAMPLIEEALAFEDPIAGIGDYGRVEEILRRFNTSEVFQLLTTLDQNLQLEGVRDRATDTRLSYIADVVFHAAQDWSQAPVVSMRASMAALDQSEQDSIVAYVHSHGSLASAVETFPDTVLARMQIGHLEDVRRERNRERREQAEESGQAPPPDLTLGEVISEDVEQRSRGLIDVEEQQRREAQALAPRVPGIITRVRASVVDTELESVIQGKTFSYEPERAIREGFYGAQLGNTLIVGVSWVRDAGNEPRSVWPNIAHELGGHLEYGETISGRVVREVLAELPEDERQDLVGDADARRRLFNSFAYAETEIFAELREMRYGQSADDPRVNIPQMLNRLRGWFAPLVFNAIVRHLWRRISASSEILDDHKTFFVQQVAALRVTPPINLR